MTTPTDHTTTVTFNSSGNSFDPAQPSGGWQLANGNKMTINAATGCAISNVKIYTNTDSGGTDQKGKQVTPTWNAGDAETSYANSGTTFCKVSGSSSSVTIEDAEALTGTTDFKYWFTVTGTNSNGERVTADPELVNKAGGGTAASNW